MARYFQRGHGPASIPAWLVVAVVLLITSADATACPACSRARLLQSYWHFKTFAVLVGAPLLVTFTRLDVVRVLYTFIPLALVSIKLQTLMLWYGYSATSTDGVPMALISNLHLAASLAAPILICCLGKLAFYRKDQQKGFLIWQPFAYCALLFMAQPYLRA